MKNDKNKKKKTSKSSNGIKFTDDIIIDSPYIKNSYSINSKKKKTKKDKEKKVKENKKNKKNKDIYDDVIVNNPYSSTKKKKKDMTKEEKKKAKLDKKIKKKKSKVRKVIKITILVLLLVIVIVAGVAVGKVYEIFKSAKLDMEQIAIKYENSIVKDIDGNTIAELTGDENRKVITISEMSQYLPKAFVAIEDERFYDHEGVDIKRTASATFKYALSKVGIGSASYGGSTITQQLIKNLTEEDERTATRKIKEMARAYYLEKELKSKDRILELYLNLIFLGDNASGVEVASNYYFSKNAKDLSLIESAFLAGINDGPNYYEPFSEDEDDIKRIKNRVKVVIEKMYQLGRDYPGHRAGISKEEHDSAMKELEETGLVFQRGTIVNNSYTYHTEAAINQVKEDLKKLHPDWTEEYTDYYVKSGGLTIYTTQNTYMQELMQAEVQKDAYKVYSKKTKDANGNYVLAQTAMVLIDHKKGQVLATVGGIGEKTSVFGQNRATQTTRSTGSSIKPLAVVAPGVDKGIITAATVFDDISYSTGQYAGFKNYGYAYKGLTTVRYAIAASQNIPMLKGINKIGIQTSMDFLKSVGISTLDDEKDAQMTLTLGGMTNGVSPLEMAGAYAAIANDGVYIEPSFYTKVVDSDGKEVLVKRPETRTVMSAAAAYVVKEVMTEVVRSGAGGYTALPGISVAAKTGTSQDDADRWYCGFTPYYTAATWFGFDYGQETVIYPPGNPSGRIWDGVMEQIHKNSPAAKFSDTKPNGVTQVAVCKCSGLLPTEACQNDQRGSQVYKEFFVKGTEPTKRCSAHVLKDVCADTGLIATEFCTNRVTKSFLVRDPAEKGNWQRAADAAYMLTSTKTCNVHTNAPAPVTPVEPTTPTPPTTPPTTPVEPTTPPTTPVEPTTPPTTPVEPTTPPTTPVEPTTPTSPPTTPDTPGTT